MQYRRGRKSPWFVQIRDASGRLVCRSFVRREDAEEFVRSVQRKRQLQKAGLEAPRDAILFFDYAQVFIKRRKQTLPESTTRQDEGRLRNYWLEKFGTRPIQTITSSEIKEHLDHIQFEMGHSSADRNRHRALMHKMFQDALVDDRVLYNPVSKIPLVDERKRRRKVDYLENMEDQEKYIAAAYAEGSSYGLLATILIWAGPRISEAIALQHKDIDYEKGIIRIRRIFERASQTLVERTKGQGEGGEYILPLFPRVKDAILKAKATTDYTRPSDFICHRASGEPISYDTFKDVHKRICEAAKIKPITIHDLRRTFASNAEKAGFSKGEIQRMLGHSSVVVTERYTRMEIDHIVEKGKRIGFGASVENVVQMKKQAGGMGNEGEVCHPGVIQTRQGQ